MGRNGQPCKTVGLPQVDATSLCTYSFASSNTYGQPRAEGVTESVIGRWMAAGRGRRDRTVLATKLYGGKASTNQLIANPSLGPVVCEGLARTLGPVG
jgi:hypothetical protein